MLRGTRLCAKCPLGLHPVPRWRYARIPTGWQGHEGQRPRLPSKPEVTLRNETRQADVRTCSPTSYKNGQGQQHLVKGESFRKAGQLDSGRKGDWGGLGAGGLSAPRLHAGEEQQQMAGMREVVQPRTSNPKRMLSSSVSSLLTHAPTPQTAAEGLPCSLNGRGLTVQSRAKEAQPPPACPEAAVGSWERDLHTHR